MTGKARVAAFLLWGGFAVCGASGQVTIPDPGTYVVDQAGITGAYRGTLETLLRELEEKTTAQVKLLTVKSLQGEDAFAFAQRHAEAWKLGKPGKDNGVLIVVVPKSAGQRGELRVQVGYGLEPILPDSYNGELTRGVVTQYMQKGQVAEGIAALTSAVANRVALASNITLGGGASLPGRISQKQPSPPAGLVCGGIVPLIILILIMRAIFGRRRYGRHWGGGVWEAMILGQMLGGVGRGRRSGWGGSRGFGGGFGGFGGSFGGGGRFGGGGGGASW